MADVPRHRRLSRIDLRLRAGGIPMNEQKIRGLIADVKAGSLSRRAFVRRMVAVGLTAPLAAQMLAYNGVAMAQSKSTYKPTKAGGGGRSEEHTSELQSLMRISYAVFCLKKKNQQIPQTTSL